MERNIEVINQKVELDKIIIEENHNYILFDNAQQGFDRSQYNTVGTYQLIKLQVTPVVMLISWLFFKAHYPLPIILSFVPVLIGTLISTYYDLQFNMFGLACALTSVMFTAMYQILVEYYQKLYNCDSLQLLFYQAPLSGLLLLCFLPFFEPLSGLDKFMNYSTISLVLLCGVVAFFVNFSIFWVIGNLSAVAYNMIGHSKTLLIIFFWFSYIS